MTGSDGTSAWIRPLAPRVERPLERPTLACQGADGGEGGFMTTRLFVAATFVAGCVLAVGVLSTAV